MNNNYLVCCTDDYENFKFFDWNRELNVNHIKKLMISYQEQDLSSTNPILIDKNFYILDGQHRFTALKELNKPIYYQIVDIDKQGIFALNSVNKKWTGLDKLHFLSKTGNEWAGYSLELIKKYNIAAKVLIAAAGTHALDKEYDIYKTDDFLKELMRVKRVLPARLKHALFYVAVLLLLRNNDAKTEHLINNIEKYGGDMQGRSSIEGYKEELLKVYNRGLRTSKKIEM